MKWIRTAGATLLLLAAINTSGSAQRVDTIVAGQRHFKMPPLGVDTIDGFSVLGDSARPTFSYTRSVTRQPDGTLLAVSAFKNVTYTTVLDAGTLTPIRTRTQAATDSAVMEFSATGVRGWADAAHSVPRKIIDAEFGQDPRPFESAGRELMIQLLPLAPGYTAVLPAIDAFQTRPVWWQLKVVGADTLTYHGARVPCWMVDVGVAGDSNAVVHRKWIAQTDRRMLQDRNLRHAPDGSQVVSRLRGE